MFQEAGYTTAGVYRNGWVGPNFGFSQGFDLYLEPAPRSDRRASSAPRRVPAGSTEPTRISRSPPSSS